MARSTYHHGDLRRALLTEARELARSAGPDAVTLREVARRLDVSPAAIYRHFPDRDALLGDVAASARLALAGRMLDEVERVDERDVRIRAIRRIPAIGRGYIRFAEEEPHLLIAAFLPIEPQEAGPDPNPWHVPRRWTSSSRRERCRPTDVSGPRSSPGRLSTGSRRFGRVAPSRSPASPNQTRRRSWTRSPDPSRSARS